MHCTAYILYYYYVIYSILVQCIPIFYFIFFPLQYYFYCATRTTYRKSFHIVGQEKYREHNIYYIRYNIIFTRVYTYTRYVSEIVYNLYFMYTGITYATCRYNRYRVVISITRYTAKSLSIFIHAYT